MAERFRNALETCSSLGLSTNQGLVPNPQEPTNLELLSRPMWRRPDTLVREDPEKLLELAPGLVFSNPATSASSICVVRYCLRGLLPDRKSLQTVNRKLLELAAGSGFTSNYGRVEATE